MLYKMENISKVKRVWQAPDFEVINTKMTKGGSHAWDTEDSWYYDVYTS